MANENAHVGSSDAIVEFRAALLTFQEEATAAVESIEMKAGQTLRFLDEDAPGYWANQTRSAYDRVNAARIALSVCRNRTVAGRKSSCIEEKKEYQRSQDRLDLCRRQTSVARQTAIETHEAADEYRARIAHLARVLETEVPKLQALLHRTSVSLEAYTASRPAASMPQRPTAEQSSGERTGGDEAAARQDAKDDDKTKELATDDASNARESGVSAEPENSANAEAIQGEGGLGIKRNERDASDDEVI